MELGISIILGDDARSKNCLGKREAARQAAGTMGWMAAQAVDAD